MTPEELADLFRSDVEDTDTDDPLWTDIEVLSYMDRSQKMFARKTDYFADASTTEIVQVSVTADNPFIALDPRITKIRGGRLVSTGRRLDPKKYNDVERNGYGSSTDYGSSFSFSNTNWETAKGSPVTIITDLEKDKGRLVPIPTINDTINLHVYRLPLLDIDIDNCDAFEITETEYQTGLIYYMKFLAYQKNDADVFNIDLSNLAKELADDFMKDARNALRRQRFSSTVGAVAYGGL